jgi:hypothetical protein
MIDEGIVIYLYAASLSIVGAIAFMVTAYRVETCPTAAG